MENNELVHYGVIGMKWGVRKSRSSERSALSKASNAIGTKRSRKFADLYKQRRDESNQLESLYKTAKSAKKSGDKAAYDLAKQQFKSIRKEQIQRGRKQTVVGLAVLGTIGVATVAAAAYTRSAAKNLLWSK